MESPPQPPAMPSVIGRDDPAPFVVIGEHGSTPVLIVCDHASRAFPRALNRLGLDELPSWQHIAWDIGAGELARGLAHALGAPAVLAGYSRLVVDCNRWPEDAEAFRTESDGWTIPGNQQLTDEERHVRLGAFFDPYHEAIAALLAGFRSRDIVPLLVAVHSFSPTLSGQARPWHAGVLWHHDAANAQRLLGGLRAHKGLVIGDNEPYSGKHPANYTIDHHANANGLPHICIEVRQDLLSSPAGIEQWVRRLARIVAQILDEPQSRRRLPPITEQANQHANQQATQQGTPDA